MRPQIKFYFSLLSPWSYFGYTELLRIAGNHNAEIIYKPMNALEMFSEMGGVPVAKRHPSRQNYRLVELQRWSRRRAISINLKPQFFPFDSQLANCVVVALLAMDLSVEQFIMRGFEAIWQKDKNLADANVISDILNDLALPATEILNRAQTPDIIAQYDHNFQEAQIDGAFGMPFMILNGEPFWGQDRLDFLEEALAKLSY